MNCCGAQEYKDWTNTTFSRPNDAVPDSCCLSDIEGCGKDILTMSDEQASDRKTINPLIRSSAINVTTGI